MPPSLPLFNASAVHDRPANLLAAARALAANLARSRALDRDRPGRGPTWARKAYEVSRLVLAGARPHPAALVESTAMGSTPPLASTYRPVLSPAIL